jgi:hypothetical protein
MKRIFLIVVSGILALCLSSSAFATQFDFISRLGESVAPNGVFFNVYCGSTRINAEVSDLGWVKKDQRARTINIANCNAMPVHLEVVLANSAGGITGMVSNKCRVEPALPPYDNTLYSVDVTGNTLNGITCTGPELPRNISG